MTPPNSLPCTLSTLSRRHGKRIHSTTTSDMSWTQAYSSTRHQPGIELRRVTWAHSAAGHRGAIETLKESRALAIGLGLWCFSYAIAPAPAPSCPSTAQSQGHLDMIKSAWGTSAIPVCLNWPNPIASRASSMQLLRCSFSPSSLGVCSKHIACIILR